MRRARLALAAVVLALAALGGVATAAPIVTKTERARLRSWDVTLTYAFAKRDGFSPLRSLHLQATLAGRVRLDRDLPLRGACAKDGCVIVDESVPLLEVRDLGGGTPTALLWLWTGGAHCCSIAQTVALADGAIAQHDFGNHGAGVVTINGVPLFTSVDDRFSYLYTSYAASGNPIQLWRLRGGRFVDVTTSYRGQIAADAAELWKGVRAQVGRREEARGVFAAWAADTCRLTGWARVQAAATQLVAAGAFSPPRTDPFGPTGAKYPAALKGDLTRFGYCRSG